MFINLSSIICSMSIHEDPRIVAEVPEFRVKYKDVFHFRNLYVMMHELFLEEGYEGYEGNKHAGIETMYSENVYQKGIHRGGKEVWVWWRFQKDLEGRGHGNFIWTLDVDFHAAYVKEIEVIHQGKKLKVNHGELEIFFRPRIESDYSGQMRNHWFMKNFIDIYEQRIMARDIEKWEKFLWRDVYKIQSKIKDFLGLKTFIPVAPQFHPGHLGHESEF